MDDRISRDVFVWQTLRERIRAQYELEQDDPALIDTLDGETDLNGNLGKVALSAKEDEAHAEAIKSLIADMQTRKARLERRAEYKRNQIAWAMQETGQTKIVLPYVTLGVRMGKPKLIIDEERLPMDFKKSKVTFSPDKELIQDAIDRGDVPEGVQIDNAAPILTVKGK
jgi:hypothetical protein